MNPKLVKAGVGLFIFLVLFLIIDDSRHDLEPLLPSSSSSQSAASSAPIAASTSSSPYWRLFAAGTFANLSASCHMLREKGCSVSEQCGVYAFDPLNVSTLYHQCPNLQHAVAGEDPTCCREVGMLQETFVTESTIDDMFNPLFNKVDAGKPSAQPAVTFVGDSTWQDFFQQIHRYICIKPGSRRFSCRSPAPDAPLFTHKWHSISEDCKLKPSAAASSPPSSGKDKEPAKWWASSLNQKLGPASFSVIDLRNNRSVYVQFFPFQSIWDGEQTSAHRAHMDDKKRLQCAKDVLEKFDQFSDGILFNIGLHYQESDKERYQHSLDLVLDVFTSMLNKRKGRLQFAIPFETLPTHFAVPPAFVATHTWGDCIQHACSLPPAQSDIAHLSAVPLPSGLFSFPCAAHTSVDTNWRNEILHKECRKKGFKVGELYKPFLNRCDLHIGTDGDCLHYDFRRHPEFLYNVTVHAFQTALLNDGTSNWHFS